jgi:hypothetical protein
MKTDTFEEQAVRIFDIEEIKLFDETFTGEDFDGSAFAKFDTYLEQNTCYIRVAVDLVNEKILLVNSNLLNKTIFKKVNIDLFLELEKVREKEGINDEYEFYYELMEPILKEYVDDKIYTYYINAYDYILDYIAKLVKCGSTPF